MNLRNYTPDLLRTRAATSPIPYDYFDRARVLLDCLRCRRPVSVESRVGQVARWRVLCGLCEQNM